MSTHSNIQIPHVAEPGNPFTPMRYVPPERFRGRSRELSEIMTGLDSKLSFSVVGEARIGKTSLLRYLEATLGARPIAQDRFLPIYLSADAYSDQATFCRDVLRRLLPHLPHDGANESAIRALELRVEQSHSVSIDELRRALEWAPPAQLRVVLLLDEFKNLSQRTTEFGDVFFGALRSLYQGGTIALVLASRQPLVEIAELNAYFVNAVSRVDLGPMLDGEAEQLICQPSDRPFGPEEVRLALEVGRCRPLRLQWCGYLLYNGKQQTQEGLYDSFNRLSDRAPNLLGRAVQLKEDEARAASTARVRRRGFAGWLAALGRAAMRTGEAADQAQAHIMGGFILIAFFVVVVLVGLYLIGALPLDNLERLLRTLVGGS